MLTLFYVLVVEQILQGLLQSVGWAALASMAQRRPEAIPDFMRRAWR